MYFDSDMSKLMQRYVGRRITVQTHGYARIVGNLASVHDSCIRLRNVIRLHELEDSRWSGEIERYQQEEFETGDAETLIATHAITSVACAEYPGPVEEEPDAVDDNEELKAASTPEQDADQAVGEGPELLNLFVGPGLAAELAKDPSELSRIKSLRRDFYEQLGFTIPKVRVRDRLSLEPNGYQLCIGGVEHARNEVRLDSLLAIHTPDLKSTPAGESTRDPVFGLPATWIDVKQKRQAETLGCTVVDPWSVIVTHLSDSIRRNASSLFSYEEASNLLQSLREANPALIASHFVEPATVLRFHHVCCQLLADGVSLSNLERIATAVAQARRMKDEQGFLHVRRLILPLLAASAADATNDLRAVVVSRESQEILDGDDLEQLRQVIDQLAREIRVASKPVVESGGRLLVVVDAEILSVTRTALGGVKECCLVVTSAEATAFERLTLLPMLGETPKPSDSEAATDVTSPKMKPR